MMVKCEICGKPNKKNVCNNCNSKVRCIEHLEKLLKNIDIGIHFKKNDLNKINIKNQQQAIWDLQKNDLIETINKNEYCLVNENQINDFFKEMNCEITVKGIPKNNPPSLQNTCQHCKKTFPIFKLKTGKKYCTICNKIIRSYNALKEFLKHVKCEEEFNINDLKIENEEVKINSLIFHDLIDEISPNKYKLNKNNIKKFLKNNSFNCKICGNESIYEICGNCQEKQEVCKNLELLLLNLDADIPFKSKNLKLINIKYENNFISQLLKLNLIKSNNNGVYQLSSIKTLNDFFKENDSDKSVEKIYNMRSHPPILVNTCSQCGKRFPLNDNKYCNDCEDIYVAYNTLIEFLKYFSFDKPIYKKDLLKYNLKLNYLSKFNLVENINDHYILNSNNINLFISKNNLKPLKKCKKCGKLTSNELCNDCIKIKNISYSLENLLLNIDPKIEFRKSDLYLINGVKSIKLDPLIQNKLIIENKPDIYYLNKTKILNQFFKKNNINKSVESIIKKRKNPKLQKECKVCGEIKSLLEYHDSNYCDRCVEKIEVANIVYKFLDYININDKFKMNEFEIANLKNITKLKEHFLISYNNGYYQFTHQRYVKKFLDTYLIDKKVNKCEICKTITKDRFCLECNDKINLSKKLKKLLLNIDPNIPFKIEYITFIPDKTQFIKKLEKYKLVNKHHHEYSLISEPQLNKFLKKYINTNVKSIQNKRKGNEPILQKKCINCNKILPIYNFSNKQKSGKELCLNCIENLEVCNILEKLLIDIDCNIKFKKANLYKINFLNPLKKINLLNKYNLIIEIGNEYQLVDSNIINKFFKENNYPESVNSIKSKRTSKNPKLQKICSTCNTVKPIHMFNNDCDKCIECEDKSYASKILVELLSYVNVGNTINLNLIPVELKNKLQKLKDWDLIRISDENYKLAEPDIINKFFIANNEEYTFHKCEKCGTLTINRLCANCNFKINICMFLETILIDLNPEIPFKYEFLPKIMDNKKFNIKLYLNYLKYYNLIERTVTEYHFASKDKLNKFFSNNDYFESVESIIAKRTSENPKLQKICQHCKKTLPIYSFKDDDYCSICIDKHEPVEALIVILSSVKPNNTIDNLPLRIKKRLIEEKLIQKSFNKYYLVNNNKIMNYIKFNSLNVMKIDQITQELINSNLNDIASKYSVSKKELEIWYQLGTKNNKKFIDFSNMYKEYVILPKLDENQRTMIEFLKEFKKTNDVILSMIFSGITEECIEYYCNNIIPEYKKETQYYIKNK